MLNVAALWLVPERRGKLATTKLSDTYHPGYCWIVIKTKELQIGQFVSC